MPTPRGYEESFFQGIATCVRGGMTGAALGNFAQTAVLGILALNGGALTLSTGTITRGNNAAQTGQQASGKAGTASPTASPRTRAGRQTQAQLDEQVWAYINGQDEAVPGSNITAHFKQQAQGGYAAETIRQSLKRIQGKGRLAQQGRFWQAVAPGLTTTGATGQATTGQPAELREPMRATG